MSKSNVKNVYQGGKFEMNGIFAIEKPVGISSAKVLAKVQSVFTHSKLFGKDLALAKEEALKNFQTNRRNKNKQPSRRYLNQRVKVKMGHGGTLDMGASGILVVGVGAGTKLLQTYLTECVKTYEADAVLGASTTSGDDEGELLMKTDVRHITRDDVLQTVEKFTGDITQTPPIFSAIKMNGKPLYEYAREQKPLPKAIKTREVTVHSIRYDRERLLSKDHSYKLKAPEVDEDGETLISKLAHISNIDEDQLHFSKQYVESLREQDKKLEYPKPVPIPAEFEQETLRDDYIPPMIRFTTTVSSGTYIRSLISDIGKALRSSAYMTALVRTRQAEWVMGKNSFKIADFENYHEEVWGEALKWIFKNGPEIDLPGELEKLNEIFLKEHPEERGKKYPIDFEDERKKEEGEDKNKKDEKKRPLEGAAEESKAKKADLESNVEEPKV